MEPIKPDEDEGEAFANSGQALESALDEILGKAGPPKEVTAEEVKEDEEEPKARE
jgi:hypothetical protein